MNQGMIALIFYFQFGLIHFLLLVVPLNFVFVQLKYILMFAKWTNTNLLNYMKMKFFAEGTSYQFFALPNF